jgi:AbrB family looped-hinge helix DNA binding protein
LPWENVVSITLTVTTKGQVTLRKEVLEHLGVHPGDRLEIDLLPSGRMQARAKSGKPVSSIFGMLEHHENRAMTIEEINEAAAAGWAGEQ